MRVFQEEIFGPVVSVTTFKDEAEAIEIAINLGWTDFIALVNGQIKRL